MAPSAATPSSAVSASSGRSSSAAPAEYEACLEGQLIVLLTAFFPGQRAQAGEPRLSSVRMVGQSAAARCSIAAVAGRLAFRNVRMCRTASGIFSGVSFHGYMLTCELGASIATSIATA